MFKFRKSNTLKKEHISVSSKMLKATKIFIKINLYVALFGISKGVYDILYSKFDHNKLISNDVDSIFSRKIEELMMTFVNQNTKSSSNKISDIKELKGNTNITNSFLSNQINQNLSINNKQNTTIIRDKIIDKLKSEEFDVLVIGGGSVGSGVAYSSCSNGLKTAVIEKNDFASGTSSRSTKIAHGGIRYLEEAIYLKSPIEKLKLVFEALGERNRIIQSAPFMNDIVQIKLPTNNIYDMFYMYYGCLVYHSMYIMQSLYNLQIPIIPFPNIEIKIENSTILKRFSRTFKKFLENNKEKRKIRKKYDSIKETYEYKEIVDKMINNYMGDIKNSLLFTFLDFPENEKKASINICLYEGQFCDSRQNILTLTSDRIRTNGTIMNYIEFVDYLYDENGKITGAKCLDKINNYNFDIKTKVACNCTGIFSDSNLDKYDKDYNNMIVASKGTHLIIKKESLYKYLGNAGMMIPKTSDGRVLFILPYLNNYLIGTTDSQTKKTELIEPEKNEVDFLVNELSDFLKIKKNDVRNGIISSWSGLRPIIYDNSNIITNIQENESSSVKIKEVSRKHNILHNNQSNLYSVLGGKWTVYLRIGEECIEKIINNNPELKTKQSLYLSEKKKLDQEKYEKIKSKSIEYAPSNDEFLLKRFPYNTHILDLQGKISNEEMKTNRIYDHKVFYIYLIKRISEEFPKVPTKYIKELVSNYGFNAYFILHKGLFEGTNKPITNPSSDLSLVQPIFQSELDYCIENEYVTKTNDFLIRRKSIGFVNYLLSKEYIESVSSYLAAKNGWTQDQLKEEIKSAHSNLKYMF